MFAPFSTATRLCIPERELELHAAGRRDSVNINPGAGRSHHEKFESTVSVHGGRVRFVWTKSTCNWSIRMGAYESHYYQIL